jgi:hypothetical protein
MSLLLAALEDATPSSASDLVDNRPAEIGFRVADRLALPGLEDLSERLRGDLLRQRLVAAHQEREAHRRDSLERVETLELGGSLAGLAA